MSKASKRFRTILVFLLVVIIACLFYVYNLLTGALPQTEGELTLASLSHPVDVFRDNFGVPHIVARNESDLFKAAGYVAAQDRLWQMDFSRRAASGRLSEIFGETTIQQDKFLRMWGFRRVAKEIVAVLPPESRQVLEAYRDGINAFIESHQSELPVEFALLGYKPEPWQLEDSVAFARLMAWKLSFSWYVDLALQQLVDKLGAEKASQLFPDFPKSGPFIVSSTGESFLKESQAFLDLGLQVHQLLGIEAGGQLGSNSWVISGEKSACGKPMLANDPHLELTTPSIWYEMHLSAGDLNVIGVALPAIPGVVIGHNEHIAWGLTNGMVDDVDFYFEKVNPENPNQYWGDGAWQPFTTIAEDIAVKGGDSVRIELRFSRNGPIISGFHSAIKESEQVVAMKWVGHQASDELTANMKLLRARDWADFLDAVQHFKVPAQNFTFASKAGDIGYYLAGTIPIRTGTTGILPHQGWETKGQWSAEVEFKQQPHMFNPPQQFIVTANNKIVDSSFPHYISNQWEPASRAKRIAWLLSAKEKVSVDDFKAIQMDITSTTAQELVPIITDAARQHLETTESEELQVLLDLLKNWDGAETIESIAPSIFNATLVKLIENTLIDEMGPSLFENYTQLGNVSYRVITALLKEDDSQWFDDIRTDPRETKNDIIVRSLVGAGEMLADVAGSDLGNWTWGQVHTLTMRHPLGIRKPLDLLLNIGPLRVGGSTMSVNKAEYRLSAPFEVNVGPSTRRIVDFCEANHSYSVITSGQSGQRLSKHYKDQASLWHRGQYRTISLDRNAIINQTVEHLTLIPSPDH